MGRSPSYPPSLRSLKINWRAVAIIAALIVVGVCVAFAVVWAVVDSTHPDKKVRDGIVVSHKFDPAHSYTYYVTVQQYAGQTCTYSSTTKSTTCTPRYNYIQEPRTGYEPDRWYITVEGCKRYKADAPIDYCAKKNKRTIQVGQDSFRHYNVGAKWAEAA